MNVDLSVKYMLEGIGPSSFSISDIINSGPIAEILSESGIKSLIGNSSVAVSVKSDRISTSLGFAIPAFLPIPREISFPYSTALGVYGGIPTPREKAIEVEVNGFNIIRTDSLIVVNTSMLVLPVNSESAATALSQSLNPALSHLPAASSIGLKDFAFMPVGTTKKFRWCDELFAGQIINFGIPAICKECFLYSSIMEGVTRVTVTDLVTFQNLDIAQLDDGPGFSAKGGLKVALSSISIDLGSFHLGTSIESSDFAAFDLPNGINFSPSAVITRLDSRILFHKSPEISSKAQNLIDTFVSAKPSPSYLGIKGLSFGESASKNIITFSKLAIDINTSSLIELMKSRTSETDLINVMLGYTKPNMVKLNSVDFAVESSSDVNLKLSSDIKNPFPAVSLSIGSIHIQSLIAGTNLVGINISPIALKSGNESPLQLQISMKLSDGSSGVSQKVAKLLNGITNSAPIHDILLGITGLKIYGKSSESIIDQFSTLKVELEAETLSTISTSSSDVLSLLDYSAILPTENQLSLSEFKPDLKYVQMNVIENGSLKFGVDFGYANPLPLAIKLPYFSLIAKISGEDLVQVEVSSIELLRTSSTMKPRLNLLFSKTDGISSTLSIFLENFLSGRNENSIGVREITFGTPEMRNNILRNTDLDVTKFIHAYLSIGLKVKEYAETTVDKILSLSALSQTNSLSGMNSSTTSGTGSRSLITISGPLGTELIVDKADLSFQKDKIISTTVDSTLKLPFEVDMSIPYISLSTDFDGQKFCGLEILGLIIKGSGLPKMSLKNSISFKDSDNEPLAIKISEIANQFTYDQVLTGFINVGNIYIGVNQADRISAFSKVSFGLPLEKLASPFRTVQISSSLEDMVKLAGKFDIRATQMGLEALPAHKIKASTVAEFLNPMPLSLNGLGYISASGGIDEVNIVNIKLPGIALSQGQNKISLNVDMEFPSENTIKNKVSSFGKDASNNFGETLQKFMVAGIKLGVSEHDYIHFLERARIGIKSSLIINQHVYDYVLESSFGLDLNVTAITSMAKLKTADVQFYPSSIISAALNAAVSVPFEIFANVPFFEVGSLVDGVLFCKFGMRGLKVSGKGSNDLSLSTKLEIDDTETLANKIGLICDAFTNGKEFPGTVGVLGLQFGVDDTPENVIDTFSLLSLSISLNPIAQKLLKAKIPTFDPSPYISALGLKLSEMKFNTAPGRIIQSSVDAEFTNDFGLSVKGLSYIAATTGIDFSPLVELSANGILIQPGNNHAKVNADLHFPDSPAIKEKVAGFADQLLNNFGNTPEKLTMTGIAFGYDSNHHFKFLQSAIIGFKSSALLNSATLKYVKKEAGLPESISFDYNTLINMAQIKKLHVDGTHDLAVGVGVGIKGIPFKAQAKIGYANFGVLMNSEKYNN